MKKTDVFNAPCAVFDFDGTLVDSNAAFIRILLDFFDSHSTMRDFDFIERAKTMNFAQTCEALKKLTGCPESVGEIAAAIDAASAAFYDNDVELKPGAGAYVRALNARGIRMCVASATEEETIRGVLERLGLMEYFDYIITVSQVGGVPKDKPDIFIEAARRFGRSPCELAVYDDALEALRSAKGAGLQTVCVYDEAGASTEAEARQLCDAYINSFEELA